MFPEITKQKKKPLFGTEEMRKEWEDTFKELDFKAKNIAKKLPPDVIADFNKICRLKEIPDFYSDYLICHAQKMSPNALERTFKAEI